MWFIKAMIIIICFLGVVFSIFIALVWLFAKLDNETYNNMSDEEREKRDEEERITQAKSHKHLLEFDNAIKIIRGITYIGGHAEVSERGNGNLLLLKDSLKFYIDGIFTNKSTSESYLSIPLDQITYVKYDLEENISPARFLALGLASFMFKKKTYYLVIEYINNGIENQVVFETGNYKDQNFINELNVMRNKSRAKINYKPDKRKINGQVQISEEEFERRKKWLIEKRCSAPQKLDRNSNIGGVFMSKYNKEFKQKVVDAYLAGEGSYKLLAKRFQIGSHEGIRKWVIAFKQSGEKGLVSKKTHSKLLCSI